MNKKKKFSELTSEKIKSMSDEDFENVSSFEKKSCVHCDSLIGYVTWWCNDKEAIKSRGTRIPGVIKCPYWKPKWERIPKKYRTPENGYVLL